MKTSLTTALLALAIGPAVAEPAPSKHFAAVKEHLELGGQALTYVDVDGDPARVAAFIDEVIEFIAAAAGGDQLPFKGKVADMIGPMGLDSIAAFGSSIKSDEARSAMRSYLHLTGERAGLLKIPGGAPEVYAASTVAPEGTDLVVELDLDFTGVPAMLDAVVGAMGIDEAERGWRQMSEEIIPPVGMSLRQSLSKLDTRVLMVGRLDDAERFKPGDAPVDLPRFEAMVRLDNMGWLVEKLADQLPEEAVLKGDGFLRVPMGPVPPGDPIMEPLAHFDTASGQLYFATGEDFLKECMAGSGGLFAEAGFAKLAEGIPEKGNSFSYVSRQFGEELAKLMRASVVDGAGGVGPGPSELAAIQLIQDAVLPEPAAAVSASVNLPDGILSMTFSEGEQGSGLGVAAISFGAVAAAVSIPVFGAAARRAEQNVELQHLRQVALALRVHAAEHEGSYPDQVDAPEMIEAVGTDRIFKFTNPRTGEVRRPLYVSGLNDSTSARHVLLASPWSEGGKRAVIFADGAGDFIADREFEERLTFTLENTGGKLVE